MAKAISYIKQIIINNSISSNTNWLYHHPQLLSHFNIATGERVLSELKEVAINQLHHHYLAGALATLRKLNDVNQHPDAFYDANDYEFISLKTLQLLLRQSITTH